MGFESTPTAPVGGKVSSESATLRTGASHRIVATKAIGLDGALDRIQAQPELTVPLLNGLEHMQVLRDRFGESVAAGTIRIESDRPSPLGVYARTKEASKSP